MLAHQLVRAAIEHMERELGVHAPPLATDDKRMRRLRVLRANLERIERLIGVGALTRSDTVPV